jgi:hypothetical protein
MIAFFKKQKEKEIMIEKRRDEETKKEIKE